MHEARLEHRLASGEPKCANCRHWLRWIVVNDLTPLPESEMPFGHCQRLGHKVEPPTTTDLSVCSKWEQRPVAVKPGHSVLMGEPVWTEWEQKDK